MDGAPGGVEDWTLERQLTLLAPLYALVDVGVVVVLVVVLDCQERIKEDINSSGAYAGTQPGNEQYHPDLGALGERVRVLEIIELHDDLTGGH